LGKLQFGVNKRWIELSCPTPFILLLALRQIGTRACIIPERIAKEMSVKCPTEL
jgi:hypothetical protein